MPADALREGLRVNRDTLLSEIFRRFPEQLSDKGRQARGVIQWKIGDREDGGHDRWFVVLKDGKCETGKDLGLEPRVTLTLGALDFIQVATANADPGRLLMRRRLRVKGDLLFAARIQGFFRIPRARPGS